MAGPLAVQKVALSAERMAGLKAEKLVVQSVVMMADLWAEWLVDLMVARTVVQKAGLRVASKVVRWVG
jgi:hypothetical protein